MIVKMTDPLRCFKPRQTRERAPRACGLNEFGLPQAPWASGRVSASYHGVPRAVAMDDRVVTSSIRRRSWSAVVAAAVNDAWCGVAVVVRGLARRLGDCCQD